NCQPLLRKRRVCGLRKTAEPLFIPGIEPVTRVMRGEEDMEICVVRTQGQFHEQEGRVYRQRCQQDHQQGNWTPQGANRGIRTHRTFLRCFSGRSCWVSHLACADSLKFARWKGTKQLGTPRFNDGTCVPPVGRPTISLRSDT